jgi:S1-C subfamily serine protease
MLKNRVLPTVIVALVGAIVGSFLMMLYASTHFTGVAGPNNTPPAVSAEALTGVSDQDRIVTAVKRTKASVVAIQLNVNQTVMLDPIAQMMYGRQNVTRRGQASGSGFVFDSKGDIVTNAHVVTPPGGGQVSKLTVVFANGDKVPAHVVGLSLGADVAIIRVDNYKKLPPALDLADSDRLQAGQWAIAIGEPYELQNSVTVGVVSAFDREEQAQSENGTYDFKGLLQTSAPINPGNSGGPLLDMDGRVIGINQLVNSQAQGIGFAIPSNTVKKLAEQLIANPGVHQGTNQAFVGVIMGQINAGFRNQTGYNATSGVGIGGVLGGSPADQAGIQGGDVILSADGKTFNDVAALQKYIESKRPGDTIRFQIWSQGVKRMVDVKLTERPAATQSYQSPGGQNGQPPQDGQDGQTQP